jgi:hypothetical protein
MQVIFLHPSLITDGATDILFHLAHSYNVVENNFCLFFISHLDNFPTISHFWIIKPEILYDLFYNFLHEDKFLHA